MSFYTFMPTLLNMSLTASVAIVLVILLRLLLKKAPKAISYALWGVVLFRLLCPVSIGSDFSVYNLFDAPTEESGTVTSVIEYVPSNIVHTEYPSVALPVPGISDVINETLPQGEEQLRADPLEGPIFIATYVWMAGVLAMVIYSIVSYIRLRGKLSVVVPLRDNIFIADDIKSPFVVGLFRPKIYLPCNLGDKEQEYIILHEQHHIKRLDHVMKALAFLALAIHWFNPLVWVAFILAGKDMEMSCDEAVIRKIGGDVRAEYSASLLTLATGRRIIAGTPLAFGEGDTKGRINNLSKWKKPTVWVVLVAVVACIVLAVCLLTNPKENTQNAPEPFGHSYRVAEIINEAPQFSFTYTVETAPRYQFPNDYGMLVSGDALDTHESDSWLRVQGAFEEVRITTENFDNYFDMGGWLVDNDDWASFRSSIKKAWRIDDENDENGAFYYFILTDSGEVYLSYGYDQSEKSLIRWLFRLERTDIINCIAVSDGINSYVEPAYYPQTDIVRDTPLWPSGEVNESGTLVFSVEHDTNALVVSEEYHNRQDKENVVIERDTYELGRNEDGKFELPVERRGSWEDTVKYYIKIKGGPGVYVMEIEFGTPTTSSSAGSEAVSIDELIPGTTYVSWQCLYMNPLSSYAAMGGDSGYKYVISDRSFTILNRNNGNVVSINSRPNVDTSESTPVSYETDIEKWSWQEFPYTDEEWAALYVPGGFGAMKGISQLYDEILYQPIEKNRFLLRVDGDLWLVELKNNPQMGTYLWSIYSLVPESAMGVAQWELTNYNSRLPVFRFEFDLDYDEISAVCTESDLVAFDADGKPSDSSVLLKAGDVLYWSPLGENGLPVTYADIHFSVHKDGVMTYAGTIYIEGNSGSEGRRIYDATIVGTGLHLDTNSEISGGVISAIASPNTIQEIENDLTKEEQWNGGIAFEALAPNEEKLSAFDIILEEPNSTVECTIGHSPTGLTLTYGLVCDDGKEYASDVVGGHGRETFENLSAGYYRLFVRNSDYSGVPAYENPADFPDVSFDAMGVMNYRIR